MQLIIISLPEHQAHLDSGELEPQSGSHGDLKSLPMIRHLSVVNLFQNCSFSKTLDQPKPNSKFCDKYFVYVERLVK